MRWVLALALALAVCGPLAAQTADQEIAGEITGEDHQTYKEIPFDVPAGVERVTVRLTYDKGNRTVIDLGLWDPSGFRGWSGGTRDRFTVSRNDATPGYLPGPIVPGRWHVQLGVPNARQGSRSAFKVEVFFDRDGAANASAAIADAPINAQAGWYRGDLHMHDAHSDGNCASQAGARVPCPLFRTVEAAADARLDFIAVTDHNTSSHFSGLRELQPFFDRLLLIPGAEVTTFGGHANVLGAFEWVDFRVGNPAVPDIAAVQRAVERAGGILSVNHPALPSGEICMGCGWTWADTDWSKIAAIEAVNGLTAEGPLAGIGFWYKRLSEGHRLTGIGASDNHDPAPTPDKARIGRPRTVVHASELSIPGILAGIRGGRVFIDVEGTTDRLLDVSASTDGQTAFMGGTLRPSGEVTVTARLRGVDEGSVRLIANGTELQVRPASSAAEQVIEFTIGRADACGWVSVNVTAPASKPLLIGNPVYIDCR